MPNYKISKNIYLEKMAFGSSVGHYVANRLTSLVYNHMVIIFVVMKFNIQTFDTEKILP